MGLLARSLYHDHVLFLTTHSTHRRSRPQHNMSTTKNVGHQRRTQPGFTLMELLVVLALIVLLLSLVWMAVGTVKRQARTSTCMNNQRQINLANFGFAADNSGTFMSPRSSPNYDAGVGNEDAIADCGRGGEEYRLFTKSGNWDGVQRVATISGSQTELENALTDGAAWEYLGDLNIYSSPLDPTNRLRSYALNAYVGEVCPDNLPIDNIDNLVEDGWRSARTLSGLPIPNKTIMSICEEDHHGGQPIDIADFNNQGWVVKSWETYQAWWDFPAPWLEEGITLSFCDGSTTFHKYRTPNLGQVLIDRSSSGNGYHRVTYPGDPNVSNYQENNSDWVWFSNRMLPGRFIAN